MKLDYEWQEAPGVRDKVLAATWARLRLAGEDRCATEAVHLRSDTLRTSIYGPLFPLAEWFVENWWHLLYEPTPSEGPFSAREALPQMRQWYQRHNLLAARDGGALPDLTFIPDRDETVIQWEPDPESDFPATVRFIGKGCFQESSEKVKQSLACFINAVLARLREVLGDDNGSVQKMAEAWDAIRSADAEEAELCRWLATMGVDPYDPDEATDALVSVVEQGMTALPDVLREDFFEGFDPSNAASALAWVEEASATLRSEANGGAFRTIALKAAPTAHEAGYQAAEQVRSEILGLAPTEPLLDLAAALEQGLGWTPGCSKEVVGPENLKSGLVGLDVDKASPLLVIPSKHRFETNYRFLLARAAFFPVTGGLSSRARLVTKSVTFPQRASRAFAAELLAPAEALKKRISTKLDDQDLEELADEFKVSWMVVHYQVKNHRLGVIEA